MQRSKYIDLSKPNAKGYLEHQKYNWWFDADEPNAFEIFDLDGFYSDRYYDCDHVQPPIVTVIAASLLVAGRDILGRNVESVLDLGCGQGQFTRGLLASGLDVVAVEGSAAGCAAALKRGVPQSRLVRHDMRLPLQLNRKFDVVMCTEVAEHLEPPFSSQLIHTISEHSDVCWFSSERPETNEGHLHHPNEQPDIFWINLFRFYGFQPLRISLNVNMPNNPEMGSLISAEAELRGRYVFVRTDEDLAGREAAILLAFDGQGRVFADMKS